MCGILPSLNSIGTAVASVVLVALSPDHMDSPLWSRDSHVGMGQVREDWRLGLKDEHRPAQDLTGKSKIHDT